jgi:hypothetical protein
MATEIAFTIAASLPTVKRYAEKKKITDAQFTEITTLIKWWVTAMLKPACIDKTAEMPWETAVVKRYKESEWDLCMRDIFAAMKLPVRQTYKIYDAISDLDSMIYKSLNPFPAELEYSRETLAKAEEVARRPLTDEQLRKIGRSPMVAPTLAPMTTLAVAAPITPVRPVTPPASGLFARFSGR